MTQPDNESKRFLANCISLLPVMLAFIACMLALGSYETDLLSIGFLAAAAMSYAPCQRCADYLWKQ